MKLIRFGAGSNLHISVENMMKRLLVLFVFLVSTTISNVTMSADVAVTSAGGGTSQTGAWVSWVVKNDEIYFCSAIDWRMKGIVRCIKAKEEKSK